MTNQEHPITPPDALQTQWRTEAPIYRDFGVGRENWFINRAAQWGWDQRGTINEAQLQERADQELELCCQVLKWRGAGSEMIAYLRAARRPKPPSLKEQALEQLGCIQTDLNKFGMGICTDTIRRALEQLDD